ncbi:DUF6094 domain-containing protein (plasmid) [Enterocloster clostridioformis]
MIVKQSGFSRTLYNEAKSGAYYTDPEHCLRIGRLFKLQGETCILEPCIGNGVAVETFLTGTECENQNAKVFGVDINEVAYEEAKQKSCVSYCLYADFLTEVKITSKVFSLCFCNPPYINTGEYQSKRMEQRFVEKIHGYLKPGGYLILIVSLHTLGDYDFLMSLLGHYTCEGLWRFDEKEYEKYHQVVFIGRRKQQIGVFNTELERFSQKLELKKIPYLPDLKVDVNFKYDVEESLEENVEIFMETMFKPGQNYKALRQSSLYDSIRSSITLERYTTVNIGRPPLPLKKDLTYLCAISGGGQGIVGTEEEQDIHLQRGSVKVIEESSYNENDDGKTSSETVRTRTQISLCIIENDGSITMLQ